MAIPFMLNRSGGLTPWTIDQIPNKPVLLAVELPRRIPRNRKVSTSEWSKKPCMPTDGSKVTKKTAWQAHNCRDDAAGGAARAAFFSDVPLS